MINIDKYMKIDEQSSQSQNTLVHKLQWLIFTGLQLYLQMDTGEVFSKFRFEITEACNVFNTIWQHVPYLGSTRYQIFEHKENLPEFGNL